MNPFSSGPSSSAPNPFSSGVIGSRTPNPFTSTLANPSLQSGQAGSLRPGFNTANPSSSSVGYGTTQVSNPFTSSSSSMSGISQSNPFTAPGGFSSSSGTQFSTSGNFGSGSTGRPTNLANPASSSFNTSFSAQGSGPTGSSFSANRPNGFISSGTLQGGTIGTGNTTANPFSSATSNNFSNNTGNPFTNVTTSSSIPSAGYNSAGFNISAQMNPFSSGQGISSTQTPFSSSQNVVTSQNPFGSLATGTTAGAQFSGPTGFTSNPNFANNSSGFFVSNPQSNPFSSGGLPSLYTSTTTSGPTSMMSNLIPAFSSNFEEPGIWRYKKIDNFSGNMKKLFFDIQKSFDKNSDSLSTIEKTSKIVKEKIKKTLETAERVLNYSSKVQTIQKRTKLTIEIVKKFENDIVGYVRDIIKVCEFCERADYYNQISSPAEFVAGLLESCDKRLENLDESLVQVEEMLKSESDSNVFKEFCQVLSLMNEKFRIVVGLSYDVHSMIDQLYEKLKFRFKELQNFHPDVENVVSQPKLEYKENKENSHTAQFRPTGNIKDLISAYPSHSILK